MKISNNALNFLLAQYRAIFKRAYVKGIASAVLLTAGLAAGQAQADYIDSATITGDDYTVKAGDTLTLSKDLTLQNLIIERGATVQVNNNSMGFNLWTEQSLQVNGGTLNLDASSGTATVAPGYGVHGQITNSDGDPANYTGKLSSKNGATINVIGTGMHFGAVDLKDSTITINTNVASGNSSFQQQTYTTNAGIGVNAFNSSLKITDSTLNLGDESQIYAEKSSDITITGSTINMTGASGSYTASTDHGSIGNAIIRGCEDTDPSEVAKSQKSVINIAESKINVGETEGATQHAGSILGAETHLTNTDITINSGDTFYIDGDFKSVTAFSKGTFEMSGGNVTIAGTLSVGNDATFNGVTFKATSADSKIEVGDHLDTETADKDAKLSISSTALQDYLTDSDPSGSEDFTGTVNLNTATLAFTDSANVNVNTLLAGATNTGKVSLAAYTTNTIEGANLTVDKAFNLTGDAKINVNATDTLTLGGGAGFDSAANPLGTNSMTTKNVIFRADADDNNPFTLQDKLILEATQDIANPYDSTKVLEGYAAKGTINGDVIIATQNASIRAGIYTTDDDITLSGGKLSIDNTNHSNSADVSLTLGSSSKFTLNGGELVIGTDTAGSINFGVGDPRATTSVVDIADAAFVTTGSNNKIRLKGNGTLILDEDHLNTVLSNTNTGIRFEKGGHILVEGDIQSGTNTGLAVNKLTSGTDVTNGSVVFSGGGTLEATGQIWLQAANADAKLNLGDSGALVAETLRLDNIQDIPDTDTSTVRNFVVADGTLIAGSSVITSNTDHQSTLTLGDGASGATLQLGYIEDNVDEWGIKDHTYTTSSDTGTITQNLTLSGTGTDASSLYVEYGTWTAKNIDVSATSGSITVGDTIDREDADGNKVVFNATLKADNLSLSGANSKVTVNDNGTLSVNGLTMSNGTVTVHGQMTVAGVEPDSDANDPNYGVNITGGSFTVAGRNAQLTFGEQAVNNITVSGDTVTAENFTSNITVQDYATLRLEFADGTSFTEAALSDLRQSLLQDSTGAAMDDGYIHLGNGTIDGLNVSGGTIDWDVLEKFKDIKDIRTTGMDSATLTNVNEQDIITANVGNIQANGNTQNVQLSDSVLSSAKDLGNGTSAFITNANGEVIGATVKAGAVVGFNGGGAVRDLVMEISDTVDQTSTVVNIAASGEAVTSFESIKGGERTELNVDGVTTVAKNMSVGTLNLNQSLTVAGDTTIEDGLYSDPESTVPAVLNTTRLTVNGDTEFGGNINATGKAVFDASTGTEQDTYLAGNNSFAAGVDFVEGNVELAHGTTETTELTLDNVDYLLLSENAQLTADEISVTGSNAASTIISVGEVAGQDGSDTWGDSTGYLTAGNIDLNGATLIVDPAYGSAASIAVTDTLGNITAQQNHDQYAGGVLNGDFVAARNGIIAVGVADTQDATALEQVQDAFATLMDSNGSLKADDVGAIVWVGKNIEVQDGYKIVVDSTKNRDEYRQAASLTTSTYGQNVVWPTFQNDEYHKFKFPPLTTRDRC